MSREYITAHGSVNCEKLPELIAQYEAAETIAYAVWSDKFACMGQFSGEDLAHLQELRIFDANREFRARRKGKDFLWRVIDDAAFQDKLKDEPDAFLREFANRTYPETQFLDVDTTQTTGTDYVTTGGGHYSMPEEGLRKVKLCNYLDYDEDGILQVNDFRLVGFEKGA